MELQKEKNFLKKQINKTKKKNIDKGYKNKYKYNNNKF